jgi:hypothetical protein
MAAFRMIEGKPHKPAWEQDKDNDGQWHAMDNTISDILEKKKANIKKKESEHQWHQEDVVKKADESEPAEPARRYYDLNNKTQCRQHLVHGNEWMTVSRIVKIRRIYREVTFSISSGKKKQAQSQQAGMKVNKSASGKKKKKRA